MKPWHQHEPITAPAHLSVHSATPPLQGAYTYRAAEIHVTAEKAPQLIDISDAVRSVVHSSGVTHGQCVIYCQHTTAALVINESEPLLAHDIEDFLERLASAHADYRHDDFGIRTENLVEDHGKNAHAHLKAMVLGSTITVPVRDGELGLGVWQHVFMVEMDKAKPRTLLVQVSGLAVAPASDAGITAP
jgi:secondary thiamine-phosphate synthase enzyme